ncbi:MAG: M23 family metallopeptidase [Desulfobacteraceae bacterium]|nr:M23 family metallopeptidase [Desulfobacteraceae bacterium]
MKAEITLEKRTLDIWGDGYFGAPRGTRTHNGIDYVCPAGSRVFSPCEGKVTKLGYPYSDDLSFRYVQITLGDRNHRVFYIEPTVQVGDFVAEGDAIGVAQDLEGRYEGITPHIHYEIKINNEHIDPEV